MNKFERAFHRVICLVCHYTHVSFLILWFSHSVSLSPHFYSFSIFLSLFLSLVHSHSHIHPTTHHPSWDNVKWVSTSIFTTYGWNSKHVNHIFFPKIEISESEIKSEKQRVATHMHRSQIEFDNMLFSMLFIFGIFTVVIAVTFFLFSLARPFKVNEWEEAKKKRIEFEIPEKIHAFSLGLTITNKISSYTLFMWWTNKWACERANEGSWTHKWAKANLHVWLAKYRDWGTTTYTHT